MNALQTQRKTAWMHTPKAGLPTGVIPSDLMYPIKVRIDDKVRNLTKDKGEGATFENTTVTTRWEFDDTVYTTNATILVFDKKLNTYNVEIGLKPFDRKDAFTLVKVTNDTDITRSVNGYGGLPTKESLSGHHAMYISEIQFPVTDILLNGGISHPVDTAEDERWGL